MALFFTLFAVFILSLFAMVYSRMFAIENGRIRVSGAHPSYIALAEGISKIAVEHGKRISLIATARTLYYFSRVLDWARGVLQRVVVRMEAMLVRRSGVPLEQGAVSLFLKDVAEHKRTMKIRTKRQAKENP